MSGRGGGRAGGGGGRGWYYKQKYGGGGRGRQQDENQYQQGVAGAPPPQQQHKGGDQGDDGEVDEAGGLADGPPRGTLQQLQELLLRLEGKPYGAYKDIAGHWSQGGVDGFSLFVDHVQGDAYAAPSRCRVVVPGAIAGYPSDLYSTRVRRMALCDYLTRTFARVVAAAGADVRAQSGGWQGEKGGEMTVDAPGQHVLERSSVLVHPDGAVEARFTVALPARGRSILGQWAAATLATNLPRYVVGGLHCARQDRGALMRHIECVEDTEALRQGLASRGLAAFVGDGSILPRQSGASDLPMPRSEAVPFQTPPSMAVQFELPNRGRVTGMGISMGVTLIVGGGFHGKSTLLEALEGGVYNKVPGDGRELVVCDPAAVKIRAEDGRRVEAVDISPFINNLPFGRDTTCFRSEDASGSTSQAANIQEALECGCRLLLVDEDTSATNFMIRDARMQALVSKSKEPITPFIARVRSLAAAGTSSILVIGGSGDYFDVADRVIAMDCYVPHDVTQEARAVAQRMPSPAASTWASAEPTLPVPPRAIKSLLPPAGARGLRVQTRTLGMVAFGDLELDLGGVEQLVDKSQTRAIADGLQMLGRRLAAGRLEGRTVNKLLEDLDREMDEGGLDVLAPGRKLGNLARPRKFELAAALNRLRSCKMAQLAR